MPHPELHSFEVAAAAIERGTAPLFPCEATIPLEGMEECGALLARILRPGEWLFLNGDLGAGKTTLTASLARALGGPSAVASPTFALMNVVRLAAGERLLHLDLYRVKAWEELLYLGLEQEIDPGRTRMVVEWAELLSEEEWAALGAQLGFKLRSWTLSLEATGDGKRRLSLSAPSATDPTTGRV